MTQTSLINKEITLEDGIVVKISTKLEYVKCKKCKAKNLIWAKAENGKYMLIEWIGEKNIWQSHFSTCPKADEFRNKRGKS